MVTAPDDDNLDAWADGLWSLYGELAGKRSLERIWLKVAEHAAAVGEGIREEVLSAQLVGLAQAWCWLTIFVRKLGQKEQVPASFEPITDPHLGALDGLGTIAFYKYPLICPHCLSPGCQCASLRGPLDKEHVADQLTRNRKKSKGHVPKTLCDLEGLFKEIFDKDDQLRLDSDIGFHYLEEVAEVAEDIRILCDAPAEGSKEIDRHRAHMIEELADVVSWSCSILRKVGIRAEGINKLGRAMVEDGLLDRLIGEELTLANLMRRVYTRNGQMVCPSCFEANHVPDNGCDGGCGEAIKSMPAKEMSPPNSVPAPV